MARPCLRAGLTILRKCVGTSLSLSGSGLFLQLMDDLENDLFVFDTHSVRCHSFPILHPPPLYLLPPLSTEAKS